MLQNLYQQVVLGYIGVVTKLSLLLRSHPLFLEANQDLRIKTRKLLVNKQKQFRIIINLKICL